MQGLDFMPQKARELYCNLSFFTALQVYSLEFFTINYNAHVC